MIRPLLPIAAAAFLTSTVASAQMLQDRSPPQHRIVHRNTLALRVNPLGLLYEGRFVYRFRLYPSDSATLRDNFVGIGLAPGASPAFARLGLYVEVAPASFATFWVNYEVVQYFGTFDLFQSFPSARSDFSDPALSARRTLAAEDPLRNYRGNGTQLTLGLNLQVRLGENIVLRNQLRVVRPQYNVRAGDTVFYDQFYDVLAPNGGWYLNNDFDAWFNPKWGLIAGVRYSATAPFYTAAQFAPGEVPGGINQTHRVGPMFGYTFFQRDGAKFNAPTVFLLAQWWLRHTYRAGQVSTQALPLLGVGFQFTGDFLPLD